MPESAALAGLPGDVALWRLLTLQGHTLTFQQLVEALDGDRSDSSLVDELHGRGFDARMVELQEGDLGHLQLPTLARTRDGGWLLVLRRSPSGWQVEGGPGCPDHLDPAALGQALAGGALDLAPALPPEGTVWHRLGWLLLRHRTILAKAVSVTLAAQGLALVGPWLTGMVVDMALGRSMPSLLGILCIGLVLAALFKAWVGWLKETTLLAFSTRFEITLEKGLFDHILHLPFRHLQGRTLGELLQTFAGLRRVRTVVLEKGLGAVFGGLSAVAYLVYMFVLLPGPAAMVALVTMVASLLALGVGYLGARLKRQEVAAGEKEYSALLELIHGAATLKATGAQRWGLARWSTRLRAHLGCILRRERLGLRFEVGYSLLGQGMSSGVLIWGGQRVLDGQLSLGELLIFVQLSAAYTVAVLALSEAVVAYLVLRPQMRAVRATFAIPRRPGGGRRPVRALTGPVRVEDLWFRYTPTAPWILQAASLRVEPGTFHHLRGASGSGKSTLLKLLGGLYRPDSGRISIGGLDPADASGCVAFLPQFPQLYAGSILENLRIFSGQDDPAHLQAVAKETGLDAWVSTLPMGYLTMVASAGGTFSGGQRQLLAMTALLASSRPLLLLDEAMSNMDWLSRKRLLNCPRFQGRTVIYASHEEVLVRET